MAPVNFSFNLGIFFYRFSKYFRLGNILVSFAGNPSPAVPLYCAAPNYIHLSVKRKANFQPFPLKYFATSRHISAVRLPFIRARLLRRRRTGRKACFSGNGCPPRNFRRKSNKRTSVAHIQHGAATYEGKMKNSLIVCRVFFCFLGVRNKTILKAFHRWLN